MEKVVFLICVLAVTVYLAVAAWEDYKTCMVSRWKHLLGTIPAIFLFFFNINRHGFEEIAIILAFSTLYIVLGFIGIYGLADGFVLANLTMFFGSIGGVVSSGVVLMIMVLAAFSFFICHVIKSIVTHKKILCKMSGALIPHLLAGYVVVMGIVIKMLA